MSKLQRYSSYKESGVEWLGEIPEHWKITKLKYVLKFSTGATPSSGVQNYYDGQEPWVTIADMSGRYIEKSHFISKKAIRECNMKRVPKDSLLYSFKLSVGQVAFTKQEIYTNEAIASFYPSQNIDLNFWYYVLPNFLIKNANTNIYGAFLLNQDLIKNALIIYPPKEEQSTIASFLDTKIAQIDQTIRQKEQLIKLLKERKQIVINEAVTKGLNPNIPMKESGVEWIGEIPEHWEVKKLKFLLKINNGQDYKNVISDEGYPVIGSGGQFAFAYQYLYDGEVLLLGRKGTIDKPLYFKGKFWTVDTMFYGIPKQNSNTKFLYYSSLSIPFQFYSTSTALPSMTQFDLNNHKISFPPLPEQTAIASYLDTKTAQIDQAIALQQNYIAKLKEYKATLIDSVVTGKVRVA